MKRSGSASFDMTLRPRRQLTLPAEICDALGIATGDRLEVSVVDGALLVKPKKAIALEALREIQRAFASSGLSEEELQGEGRKIRERLSSARYGQR